MLMTIQGTYISEAQDQLETNASLVYGPNAHQALDHVSCCVPRKHHQLSLTEIEVALLSLTLDQH